MFIGLFGLPGAGKGTQAARLAEHCSIPHISTGDIFREMQHSNSPLAQEIKAILASGQLVSDEMVTKIAFDRLGREDCRAGFILDGYPRTLPQAEALQSSPYALKAFIALEVSRDEIIRRLSDRRLCPTCGSIYSLSFLPKAEGICPKDKTPLIIRADDAVEAINTRLEIFEKNFKPVMEFFTKKGLLHHVDGAGDESLVFSRLMKVIGGFTKEVVKE